MISARATTVTATAKANDPLAGAKKRAKADAERVRRTTERLRKASEAKRKRAGDDFKVALENIDRLAREEVRDLAAAFGTGSGSEADDESDFFEELDGVVVFKDDDDDINKN